MGNKITEVRYRLLRSGVEVQGVARTDRGTKYIEDAIVVPFPSGRKYPSKEALEQAVTKLLNGE